jgi:long-subunit acyl-CoA synthetase (AMP-forming)
MRTSEAPNRQGFVGRLIPTFQARLVSEDGHDVEKGKSGELWLRGPSVMKGYWKNAEATANTFAKGGWFKTGDVAVINDEGYFS